MSKTRAPADQARAAQISAYRQAIAHLARVRAAYAKKVGHTCPRYETARTYAPHYEGLSDPALQEGIGCPICYPPDGRVHS